MSAMKETFPKILIQFEDFSTPNAFALLDKFRSTSCVFNDDIQGTASVIYAGFSNAARIASEASNGSMLDHKVVLLGAGSAAVGVAKQMQSFFVRQGMTADQARERFWLVDTRGVIAMDRGDDLAEHKLYFARRDNNGQQCRTLMETLEYVRPTTLIGLSTTSGAFNEDICRFMVGSLTFHSVTRS